MLCDGTGRAAGIWKRPWNGIAARRKLGEAMADYNMGWHLEQAGKLSEAYAHYRKAADGNDDSAWWALGRFYETASSLRRTERKRAAVMKLARNWAV